MDYHQYHAITLTNYAKILSTRARAASLQQLSFLSENGRQKRA